MLFKEAVSKRIQELAATENYSINGLAEISTVPPSTLRDLIHCRINNPSSYVIYQICKALNIPLEEFFNITLFDFNKIED